MFKAHVVAPIETVTSRDCENHEDQPLAFFCTQCGVPVCAHCLLMGGHVEHPRVSLHSAVGQKQKALAETVGALKVGIKPKPSQNPIFPDTDTRRQEHETATLQKTRTRDSSTSKGNRCCLRTRDSGTSKRNRCCLLFLWGGSSALNWLRVYLSDEASSGAGFHNKG